MTIKHNLFKADWLQVMQADIGQGREGRVHFPVEERRGKGLRKNWPKPQGGAGVDILMFFWDLVLSGNRKCVFI